MIEFKQIICPVDFSESSVRAFAHAAAIAQWYDAQLTVLHVVPSFDPVQVRGDLTDPVRVVTPSARTGARGDASISGSSASVAPGDTGRRGRRPAGEDLLLADGKIDPPERRFLQRLAANFGIDTRMAAQAIDVMLVKNHL